MKAGYVWRKGSNSRGFDLIALLGWLVGLRSSSGGNEQQLF